jgi:hypothetical protein
MKLISPFFSQTAIHEIFPADDGLGTQCQFNVIALVVEWGGGVL